MGGRRGRKVGAYLETSVWNRLLDESDPERRRMTRRFMLLAGGGMSWASSAFVLDELEETPDAKLRARLIRRHRRLRPQMLPLTPLVPTVFEDLVVRRIGSENWRDDTFHLATAIAHGVDWFVSWDRRHLSNDRVRTSVREYCLELGYNPMRIGTPGEALQWRG